MQYKPLSSLRRADQLFFEQISERVTLGFGLAFHAPEFPLAVGDNAFREVLIEAHDDLDAAWTEVEEFYTARQLVCRRWVPSSAQDVEILAPFLESHGFARREDVALQVIDWPDLDAPNGLRVLPARAMRRAFRSTYDIEHAAELAERRLDYAQYDVFVAMKKGEPVGRCGLFQAGEIAEIRELFVTPSHRRTGIATALIAEVLGMARRLMMRIVTARVDAACEGALTFLKQSGFTDQGRLIEFDRTSD